MAVTDPLTLLLGGARALRMDDPWKLLDGSETSS